LKVNKIDVSEIEVNDNNQKENIIKENDKTINNLKLLIKKGILKNIIKKVSLNLLMMMIPKFK